MTEETKLELEKLKSKIDSLQNSLVFGKLRKNASRIKDTQERIWAHEACDYYADRCWLASLFVSQHIENPEAQELKLPYRD